VALPHRSSFGLVVPKNFNEFFAASATVSGALIGLLFVAISVSPEKLSSQGENVEHQIKAAGAFSALINTLIVCLLALIPGNGFAEATFILAVVGLTSTVGLIIFFLRNRRLTNPSGPDRFSSSPARSCSTHSSWSTERSCGVHLTTRATLRPKRRS
jgi:hypothetical protein